MNAPRVSIGLINPKTPSNVGAVMRAAGCYQVDNVYYTGKRYDRAERLNTDTQKMGLKISLTRVDVILESVPVETKKICIEFAEGATPLPEFQHPEDVMYIFGPEDGTISQDVIDDADAVVYVPTIGCMNLAATVNVVLYDRLAKSDTSIASDELIRKSRDNNNQIKT